MPFINQDGAIISNRESDYAVHGYLCHRRDVPNSVLVFHREIPGAVRPSEKLLTLLHFSLRYLLNPRPRVMPHQSLKMPLLTSLRAADQKQTGCDGKNKCESNIHSAMERPDVKPISGRHGDRARSFYSAA